MEGEGNPYIVADEHMMREEIIPFVRVWTASSLNLRIQIGDSADERYVSKSESLVEA